MSNKKQPSKFYLVLFTQSREVDVVPANWIYYNSKKDTSRCKFMPAPYDESKNQMLQSMNKNCDKPLPNWPEYTVEIRGRADTYKDAEERLKILKYKPYAFTTDNEESAKLKASQDIKLFKIKTNTNSRDNLKNKLNMANVKFNSPGSSGKKKSSSKFNKIDRKSKGKGKKNSSKSSESNDDDDYISETPSVHNSPGETTDSSPITNRSKSLKRKKRSPKTNLNKQQKLHDSSSSSNNSGIHNDSDSKQSSGQQGSSLLAPRIDKPIPTISTISKDSAQNSIIIKYFTSISKQIGQLNSLLVQNTAELNSLATDMKDIKRNLKKKCTCGGGDDDNNSVYDSNDDQDNPEDGTQDTGGQIKKFDFPIDAKNIFDDSNNQLDTESRRKQVMKRMRQLINRNDSLNKNMTAIMRAYISRNVATLYVPSKSSMRNQSKPVFKNTHFYQRIEDVMRQDLKNPLGNDLTDKDILNSLASTIRNARDWEGHRLLRTQKLEEPAVE